MFSTYRKNFIMSKMHTVDWVKTLGRSTCTKDRYLKRFVTISTQICEHSEACHTSYIPLCAEVPLVYAICRL